MIFLKWTVFSSFLLCNTIKSTFYLKYQANFYIISFISTQRGLTYFLCRGNGKEDQYDNGYGLDYTQPYSCEHRQNNETPQVLDNHSYLGLPMYKENEDDSGNDYNDNNNEYTSDYGQNRGLSCKHAKNYNYMVPRIPNEYDKSKVLYILYNGPEIIDASIIDSDVIKSKSLQKLLSLYEKAYQKWHQQQFKCDNNPFCPKIQKIVFKIYTISEEIRQEIEKYNSNN
ncbi:uncharacterized protein CMU_019170 [Cryptosporidium muris RN66]|uniref:Uncharacterized protein n=1 Tax=Cryptosporidium muris (strain RN66) TaxID=441375 RepID=B6ACA4_CRYMR|nr:uncharacterized protein CMU_019170 [Cryptosporidium muris RN66]EEA06160.1 hypothetical protein CMU_019170 [Cryptosporidium muris RN66]|eukprot:XP_002140509.1 hypothetical protein [Cryptosporidium muris RN66]